MSKKKQKHYAIFSISILIIVLTTLAFMSNGFLDIKNELNPGYLGNYGDFIGGFLGTVLTIIATIYIYKTYHSQKKELKSQKNELKLQRDLITQQQFETTFFNMLNVHRELKNNLELNVIKRICSIKINKESMTPSMKGPFISPTTISEIDDFKGINVFKLIRLDFEILYHSFKNLNDNIGSQTFSQKIIKDEIRENLLENRNLLNKSEKEILDKIFWIIFDNYRNIISHYCRNTYHILKFIRDKEHKSNINYKQYANIFQSQLNEDEQFILFYNYIAFQINGENNILYPMNIINHYEFLENLGHENLLNNELHNNKKFYNFEIK